MKEFTPVTTKYPTDKRFKDMKGKRVYRLLVLEYAGHSGKKDGHHWKCKCDCGNITYVTSCCLRQRNPIKSCGCLVSETMAKRNYKHGYTGHYLHRIWWMMVERCHNPKHKSFNYYGGRGIYVCDEWKTDFKAFYDYVGERPEGKTLDRIDNSKGYMPGNVRWASIQEQNQNQRSNIVNPSTVKEIRKLYSEGVGCTEISRRLKIPDDGRHVWAIANRKIWDNI